MIGIALAAFTFGIILLAYLFLFGAILGLILYFVAWIREKFFAPKQKKTLRKKSSRIIDSDDWKVM